MSFVFLFLSFFYTPAASQRIADALRSAEHTFMGEPGASRAADVDSDDEDNRQPLQRRAPVHARTTSSSDADEAQHILIHQYTSARIVAVQFVHTAPSRYVCVLVLSVSSLHATFSDLNVMC